MIGSRSVYQVMHPRGSYIVYPLLSMEVATPENKSANSTSSSTCKKVRLTSGCYSDEAHPLCDSPNTSWPLRLMQAMSVWSVKTRRAPSRHCTSRDARVYGHTTTVMYDMSTPPLCYLGDGTRLLPLSAHALLALYNANCDATQEYRTPDIK